MIDGLNNIAVVINTFIWYLQSSSRSQPKLQKNGNAKPRPDASFEKAIESIAALKLHNYAMRRRQHIAQKIKVTNKMISGWFEISS